MQVKICEDYVRLMGGEVFDHRSDEFISGKNIDDRPSTNEMRGWSGMFFIRTWIRMFRSGRLCENTEMFFLIPGFLRFCGIRFIAG